MNDFKPDVVIFRCNFCTPADSGPDLFSKLKANCKPRVIQITCTGRIDPTFIFDAFASGADGIMVAGCYPGDCHYVTGNYKAQRNLLLLQKTLGQLGIEPERINTEWAPASETQKVKTSLESFVDRLVTLGPLNLN